jgi:hypothetical protein
MNCTLYLKNLGINDWEHIHKVMLVTKFPEPIIAEKKNVFNNCIFRPCLNFIDLEDFYETCISFYEHIVRNFDYELDNGCILDKDKNKYSNENSLDKVEKKLSDQIENTDHIDTVYIEISYPVRNNANFIFTVKNTKITWGLLIYLHAIAYKLMYFIEEQIDDYPPNPHPFIMHRRKTYGRFQIYDHELTRFAYNGNMDIQITDNYIYANVGSNL